MDRCIAALNLHVPVSMRHVHVEALQHKNSHVPVFVQHCICTCTCRSIAALICPVSVQHVEYSFWNQPTRNNFAKTLPEGKESIQN